MQQPNTNLIPTNQPGQAYNNQPVMAYPSQQVYGAPVQAQPVQYVQNQQQYVQNSGIPNYNTGNVVVGNPGAQALLSELEHKKGCLKCMYITTFCCWGLAIIGCLIFFVLFDTIFPADCQSQDQNRPNYRTKCFTPSEKDDIKISLVASFIIIVILTCLVGSLYNAIAHHEPRKIKMRLIIMAVIILIDWIRGLVTNPTGGISTIVVGLIWYGIMFHKTWEYACIVRRLKASNYDTSHLLF